jgi:hypothetical protein
MTAIQPARIILRNMKAVVYEYSSRLAPRMDKPPTFSGFCSSVYALWSDTVTGSKSASFVILAAILALVSIVFAANLDRSIWFKIAIGAFPTFLFFFVAFIYALFSLWRQQTLRISELSNKLVPVLSLEFDQNSDGIVLTPIKIVAFDEHGRQTIIDSNGSYVRIRYRAIRNNCKSVLGVHNKN